MNRIEWPVKMEQRDEVNRVTNKKVGTAKRLGEKKASWFLLIWVKRLEQKDGTAKERGELIQAEEPHGYSTAVHK